MSFTEPTADRPRRSGARRAAGSGRPPADRDLLTRRIVFAVGGVLLLVLVVFGSRSCLDARQERSYRDYVRDTSDLGQQSDQLSRGLFGVLRDPGDAGAVDVQNRVNGFRVQADQLVLRAREIGPPDEMEAAHGYLIESLEFRRDGLGQIARQLPTALGDDGREDAAERIAGSMQNFLVSDAIYSQRVVPGIVTPLRAEQLAAEVEVPKSQFLPDIDWLRTGTVSDRLARVRGAEEEGAPAGAARGTGLGSVTAGGQTLTAGSPAQLTAGRRLTFAVEVQNQGEAPEKDVAVRVSVTGGPRPIEVEQQIEEVAPGQSETVNVPLTEAPPTGRPVTIEVRVEPVSGEKMTENNEASYTATFSGG